MVPTRIGSERFKKKQLAMIDGKSLLEWGISIAKNVFDHVIVNGDHDVFNCIASKNDVEYYGRPKELGSSFTKSDDVIFDFLSKHKCENIIWLNTIAPLQPISDVKGFAESLVNFDSQFAIKKEYIQTLYKGKPLNYDEKNKFTKTQDLDPVELFVPSLMGWNSKTFLSNYDRYGNAFFCGNTNYYKVSKLSCMIVKTEEDFRLLRSIVNGIDSYHDEIEYEKQ